MEFCHILNKFAAQLDECLSFKDFCLRQNSRASFRRKLGGSAICSKYEQNSTAALSVAYLFFIIYQKSIEWTIHKIFPEASKYTACSLKVSGTVSSKEAEEVWYPASFLEQDPDPMGCARHICIKKQWMNYKSYRLKQKYHSGVYPG